MFSCLKKQVLVVNNGILSLKQDLGGYSKVCRRSVKIEGSCTVNRVECNRVTDCRDLL